ncbi:RNA exonuclease 3, partial [Coelomomyces lativittatus]
MIPSTSRACLPSIEPNPRLQISHAKRLNVLKAFFDQYIRIFEDYLPSQPNLPGSLALEDETKLAQHESWKETDYTRTAATMLLNLKRLNKVPLGLFQDLTYADLVPWFPSDATLIQHGFPTCDKAYASDNISLPLDSFTCDRCSTSFSQDSWKENEHPCVYHWQRIDGKGILLCCGRSSLPGCVTGPHVYSISNIAQLHLQIPYLVSSPTATINLPPLPPLYPILVMTTQVCYTTSGQELAQICVLTHTGEPVIQELCQPSTPILDLNTKVTGIHSLEQAQFTLEEIRNKVLQLMNEDTVIIGHALQHSFNALRLIHPTVIDTSILFPHPK